MKDCVRHVKAQSLGSHASEATQGWDMVEVPTDLFLLFMNLR